MKRVYDSVVGSVNQEDDHDNDNDSISISSLPLDVQRLIIEYAGLKLIVDPVCRAWLTIAFEFERQSLDEWMHEMGRSDSFSASPVGPPSFNLLRELGITHPKAPTVNQWCAGLRGIPNLVDLDFCRALRKLQKLNEWLIEQRWRQLLRQQTPPEKRLLKNLYLLWNDGFALRVLRREHYNHLLRRPRDLVASGSGGVISPVAAVPLDDEAATEQHICMPGGPLHSISLLLLPFDVKRWGGDAAIEWGDDKKRIASLDEYRQLEDLGRVSFVYVTPFATGGNKEGDENIWSPDTVMQYLRNMRHWHKLARHTGSLCVLKKKLARELLPSVWYGHCTEFAEQTLKDYESIVAQGGVHWAFADAQMACDLCEVTKCGLLVVDSKSTRVHAPISYSDSELEWSTADGDDGDEDPYKAYVRVYMPLQFFGRLKRRLPPDIFYSESDAINIFGCAVNDNFMNAQGFNRRQQIAWPDMDTRSNQIEWEQQTFGLDRMPTLLDLVLVEFVDGKADRPDGYLFATLLALCKQFLADDAEARLHIASDRVLLDEDASRVRNSYQNVLLWEPAGRQALRVVEDTMTGLIFEQM